MKNLKIRTKLLVLSLFLLVCLIGVGGASLVFMNNINKGSTDLANAWLPSVIVAEELNTNTSDFRIQEYKHIVSQDAEEMKQCETEMERINNAISDLFNQYVPLITNDTDKKLMEDAQNAWKEYLAVHDEMIALSRNNKTDEAMAVMADRSATLFTTASDNFLKVVDFNKAGGEQASLDGDQLYAQASGIMVFTLIVVFIIGILFSIVLIRTITKPVHEIDHVAKKIADGQLNEQITYQSKDELGVLSVNFNKTVTRLRDYVNYIDEISKVLNQIADGNLMFDLTYDYVGEFAKVKEALIHISDSLNDTLGQINQSSEQVASGADQVSGGAQALSQGATEQASSIQELSATITEISGQIKENAVNAEGASREAARAGEEIDASNAQMQQLIDAMSDIKESSSQISRIIKTIEDIAFQTNILALNAAVEAARAGEAGKGFAVVADEVRSLASQSAEASNNTATLIENSVHAVENGTKIADGTANSLLAVVEVVKSVSGTINKIARASEEQANSVEQVTQGVEQISAVVQTNSATAEESAAASEELSGQAATLKQLVARFRLKTDSSSSASVGYAPAATAEPANTSFAGGDKY